MTVGGSLVLLLHVLVLMVLAAWSTSLLLWPYFRFVRSDRADAKPSGSWFLLGISPFLAGLTVGGASFSTAALKGFGVIADHCQTHSGHPHLCWAHTPTLLPQGLVFWTLVIGGGSLALVGVVAICRPLFETQRRLRSARRVETAEGFVVVPSRLPAAFVAGLLRPRAYLTSAAQRLLSPEERRIVGIHEAEHRRRRDPLKLALLRLAARLFPGCGSLVNRWRAAVELECDWACVEKGASVEEVSLTILKLARFAGGRSAGPVLAYAAEDEAILRRRVESLVSGRRPSLPTGRRTLWTGVVLAMCLSAVGLTQLHHALETILGIFVG